MILTRNTTIYPQTRAGICSVVEYCKILTLLELSEKNCMKKNICSGLTKVSKGGEGGWRYHSLVELCSTKIIKTLLFRVIARTPTPSPIQRLGLGRPENFGLGPGSGFILWGWARLGPGSLFSEFGLELGLLLNKQKSQARRPSPKPRPVRAWAWARPTPTSD
jgi:hypothetical protein